MHEVREVKLTELEWRVLMALKRDLDAGRELTAENLWEPRAREADLPLPVFFEIAEETSTGARCSVASPPSSSTSSRPPPANASPASTPSSTGPSPQGREIEAGGEVGRHDILTHCYWREGGPEFKHVNIMAVAHGTDRDLVRAHKAAIDQHLQRHQHALQLHECFLGAAAA